MYLVCFNMYYNSEPVAIFNTLEDVKSSASKIAKDYLERTNNNDCEIVAYELTIGKLYVDADDLVRVYKQWFKKE